MLFRFRPLARFWAVLLILVNLGALLFLDTWYGRVALAAIIAAVVVMIVIHAKLGFVRLLGIGHLFWIPMLVWFAVDLPNRATHPALWWWVILLMGFNLVSLVIDSIDVWRFIRSERDPHYVWERPADASPRRND